MAEKNQFFEYKNKPLVRCGNFLYYGRMGDPFVTMLQIMGTEDFQDLHLPTRVAVKLILTDETKSPLERIVKSGERESLYQALELADIWLNDALRA